MSVLEARRRITMAMVFVPDGVSMDDLCIAFDPPATVAEIQTWMEPMVEQGSVELRLETDVVRYNATHAAIVYLPRSLGGPADPPALGKLPPRPGNGAEGAGTQATPGAGTMSGGPGQPAGQTGRCDGHRGGVATGTSRGGTADIEAPAPTNRPAMQAGAPSGGASAKAPARASDTAERVSDPAAVYGALFEAYVFSVVRAPMDRRGATGMFQIAARRELPRADHHDFVEFALLCLEDLSLGEAMRFGLTAAQYEAWRRLYFK